jgi:hypothetical protein
VLWHSPSDTTGPRVSSPSCSNRPVAPPSIQRFGRRASSTSKPAVPGTAVWRDPTHDSICAGGPASTRNAIYVTIDARLQARRESHCGTVLLRVSCFRTATPRAFLQCVWSRHARSGRSRATALQRSRRPRATRARRTARADRMRGRGSFLASRTTASAPHRRSPAISVRGRHGARLDCGRFRTVVELEPVRAVAH